MSRVVFSIAARQDLHGIFDYIAADRPRAAIKMVDDIENRCRILADHPLAAEAHPEFGADVRLSTVRNYVIFYRPIPDGIEVIRVVHGSRNLDLLL